jgi:hypothetical protein
MRRASVEDHVETLRAYANCLVASVGDTIKLIPNRPTPVSGYLTEDMIVEGSFSMSQISTQDHPTVISIKYTNSEDNVGTAIWPWLEPEAFLYHPDVLTGTLDYRDQSIDLPGIHHEAQARRVATQRMNYYNLVNLKVACTVFDSGLEWTIGDVIAVTHSNGLTKKPMRLISQEATGPGRYALELEEYDEKVYSENIETVPSYPDTVLRKFSNIPLPEDVYYELDTSGNLVLTWKFDSINYP